MGRATWEALSGNPVSNSVFDAVETVNHVRLGHEADLVVVAPATADLLARAAAGLAGDLLTNTLLMARGAVVMVPAMHTEMWQHPATAANVATLRGRGTIVMEPAVGRLTGKDTGPGRLPEPEEIFDFVSPYLSPAGAGQAREQPLSGRRVVVTAGGTREPLDPVRFLGNRSSGKQGVALARAAAAAGARVQLIAAHMDVPAPENVGLTRVETALQMREATLRAAAGADVVIMAAAVADFRPAQAA
ncbi:bifunctional phosphopantothenoylcysteine decarboxylase/phosphopantothenate--cysteine ligase CoaBC, partial [Arthrobacter deserti]|nr:bifunctional phosphopantothenoylcysteine decarboxylase/phosphopantothenate--cysteine ligase CoaBC [Arthrobacter deserti]